MTQSKNARKVKIMDVTPELAERWLNSNTHNRPLRDTLVNKYVQTMKAGEWKLTSEPIAFSKPFTDSTGTAHKETLIEGQHRLWAIVLSKVTVQMTVWWNCEPEEFAVIGQGATRTQGDILTITNSDLKDPTIVSSVISATLRFGFAMNDSIASWQTQAMMTGFREDLIAAADDKKKLKKMASRPVISGLFLARLVNPGMTDIIVHSLKEAIGFTDRDPVRALHIYLHEQSAVGGRRDTADIVNYKVCHAICARLRGDPLKVLRVTTEGLAWLRDAASKRIEPVVREVHGGRLPKNFYTPSMAHIVEEPAVNLDRVDQIASAQQTR